MTPTLVQSFLDDIVEHPTEHERWLILADWLEDQNDPRAELVRLTWSLQYEPDDPEFNLRQTRVQALVANGVSPVRPRLTLAHGIEFVWISPGTFLMGSPPGEKNRTASHEKLHAVTLTLPFWMSVHPITQDQWQAVMGDNPSLFSRVGAGHSDVAHIPDADLARFPVEMISHVLAEDYCQRLSSESGQRITLPTEAEWEYACRAGTTTPFSFGSLLNGEQANSNGLYPYASRKKGPALSRPSVVGAYGVNPWGLADMHGNVKEWVQDGYYPRYERLDPVNPMMRGDAMMDRVVRGGCCRSQAFNCRSAARSSYTPTEPGILFGFRVCLRPELPSQR